MIISSTTTTTIAITSYNSCSTTSTAIAITNSMVTWVGTSAVPSQKTV